MSDLIDDVTAAFAACAAKHTAGKAPVRLMSETEMDLSPGFTGMRMYYQEAILAANRRGYRFFAGSTLPTDSDQLLELTKPEMLHRHVTLTMMSFADGVLLGHHDEHLVKMFIHYGRMDELFNDSDFREKADAMAKGFALDPEVLEYFRDHVNGGLAHLTHMTGYAHQQLDPSKIWDLWMINGTACCSSGYLAGYMMGTAWQERDVLDGIEIATEEDVEPRGSQGADERNR